jgi:hypothetical protein
VFYVKTMPKDKTTSRKKGKKPRRRQGLRVRASEGSNLVQGGRATEYTPPRLMGGMQPFLNSGLIAPPPLMQVPYGYRELNRSIPAMPYVKDDAMDTSSTVYIPSTQEQIREAFANLMQVDTYADLQKLTPAVVGAKLADLVASQKRATNSSSSSSSSTPMGPVLNPPRMPRLDANTGSRTIDDYIEEDIIPENPIPEEEKFQEMVNTPSKPKKKKDQEKEEEREDEDEDEFQDARSRAPDDNYQQELDAMTDLLRRV